MAAREPWKSERGSEGVGMRAGGGEEVEGQGRLAVAGGAAETPRSQGGLRAGPLRDGARSAAEDATTAAALASPCSGEEAGRSPSDLSPIIS